MRPAFNLVKHLRDVVQIEPGPPATQVADFNLEGLPRPRRGRGGQTSAERLVDDRAERPPSPSRERLQLGGDVVIQRQGGSHILMLTVKHHDVKVRIRGAPWYLRCQCMESDLDTECDARAFEAALMVITYSTTADRADGHGAIKLVAQVATIRRNSGPVRRSGDATGTRCRGRAS